MGESFDEIFGFSPSNEGYTTYDTPSDPVNNTGTDSLFDQMTGTGGMGDSSLPLPTQDAFAELSSQPVAAPVYEQPQESEGIGGVLGEIPKGLAHGVLGLKQMGYGLGMLGADVLGLEGARDWAVKGYEETTREMEPYKPAVGSFADIDNAYEAGQYLAHGIASNIPMMASSFGAGAIGAVIAKSAAKKAIETAVTQEAAKAIAKKAIQAGAMSGAFAGSAGMETGSIAGEQWEENKDISPVQALIGGAVAGALDVVPEWFLAKRLGLFGDEVKEIEKGAMKRLLHIGKGFGTQFVMEAPTESAQSIIERMSVPGKSMTNAEAWNEYIDSFLLGGLTGGVFGGAGAAFTKSKRGEAKPAVEGEQKQEGAVKTLAESLSEEFGYPVESELDITGKVQTTVSGNFPLPKAPRNEIVGAAMDGKVYSEQAVEVWDKLGYMNDWFENRNEKLKEFNKRAKTTFPDEQTGMSGKQIVAADMGLTYDPETDSITDFDIDDNRKAQLLANYAKALDLRLIEREEGGRVVSPFENVDKYVGGLRKQREAAVKLAEQARKKAETAAKKVAETEAKKVSKGTGTVTAEEQQPAEQLDLASEEGIDKAWADIAKTYQEPTEIVTSPETLTEGDEVTVSMGQKAEDAGVPRRYTYEGTHPTNPKLAIVRPITEQQMTFDNAFGDLDERSQQAVYNIIDQVQKKYVPPKSVHETAFEQAPNVISPVDLAKPDTTPRLPKTVEAVRPVVARAVESSASLKGLRSDIKQRIVNDIVDFSVEGTRVTPVGIEKPVKRGTKRLFVNRVAAQFAGPRTAIPVRMIQQARKVVEGANPLSMEDVYEHIKTAKVSKASDVMKFILEQRQAGRDIRQVINRLNTRDAVEKVVKREYRYDVKKRFYGTKDTSKYEAKEHIEQEKPFKPPSLESLVLKPGEKQKEVPVRERLGPTVGPQGNRMLTPSDIEDRIQKAIADKKFPLTDNEKADIELRVYNQIMKRSKSFISKEEQAKVAGQIEAEKTQLVKLQAEMEKAKGKKGKAKKGKAKAKAEKAADKKMLKAAMEKIKPEKLAAIRERKRAEVIRERITAEMRVGLRPGAKFRIGKALVTVQTLIARMKAATKRVALAAWGYQREKTDALIEFQEERSDLIRTILVHERNLKRLGLADEQRAEIEKKLKEANKELDATEMAISRMQSTMFMTEVVVTPPYEAFVSVMDKYLLGREHKSLKKKLEFIAEKKQEARNKLNELKQTHHDKSMQYAAERDKERIEFERDKGKRNLKLFDAMHKMRSQGVEEAKILEYRKTETQKIEREAEEIEKKYDDKVKRLNSMIDEKRRKAVIPVNNLGFDVYGKSEIEKEIDAAKTDAEKLKIFKEKVEIDLEHVSAAIQYLEEEEAKRVLIYNQIENPKNYKNYAVERGETIRRKKGVKNIEMLDKSAEGKFQALINEMMGMTPTSARYKPGNRYRLARLETIYDADILQAPKDKRKVEDVSLVEGFVQAIFDFIRANPGSKGAFVAATGRYLQQSMGIKIGSKEVENALRDKGYVVDKVTGKSTKQLKRYVALAEAHGFIDDLKVEYRKLAIEYAAAIKNPNMLEHQVEQIAANKEEVGAKLGKAMSAMTISWAKAYIGADTHALELRENLARIQRIDGSKKGANAKFKEIQNQIEAGAYEEWGEAEKEEKRKSRTKADIAELKPHIARARNSLKFIRDILKSDAFIAKVKMQKAIQDLRMGGGDKALSFKDIVFRERVVNKEGMEGSEKVYRYNFGTTEGARKILDKIVTADFKRTLAEGTLSQVSALPEATEEQALKYFVSKIVEEAEVILRGREEQEATELEKQGRNRKIGLRESSSDDESEGGEKGKDNIEKTGGLDAKTEMHIKRLEAGILSLGSKAEALEKQIAATPKGAQKSELMAQLGKIRSNIIKVNDILHSLYDQRLGLQESNVGVDDDVRSEVKARQANSIELVGGVVYRPKMTFGEFMLKMRELFSKAWNNIKELAARAWRAITFREKVYNNEAVTKAEVESSVRLVPWAATLRRSELATPEGTYKGIVRVIKEQQLQARATQQGMPLVEREALGRFWHLNVSRVDTRGRHGLVYGDVILVARKYVRGITYEKLQGLLSYMYNNRLMAANTKIPMEMRVATEEKVEEAAPYMLKEGSFNGMVTAFRNAFKGKAGQHKIGQNWALRKRNTDIVYVERDLTDKMVKHINKMIGFDIVRAINAGDERVREYGSINRNAKTRYFSIRTGKFGSVELSYNPERESKWRFSYPSQKFMAAAKLLESVDKSFPNAVVEEGIVTEKKASALKMETDAVLREKERNRKTLQQMLRRGEITDGHLVRFTNIRELLHMLQTGRVYTGKDFEGRSGTSAQRVNDGENMVAYGRNDEKPITLVFKPGSEDQQGGGFNDWKIKPNVSLNDIDVIVDGKVHSVTSLEGSVRKRVAARQSIIDAWMDSKKGTKITKEWLEARIANAKVEETGDGRFSVKVGEFAFVLKNNVFESYVDAEGNTRTDFGGWEILKGGIPLMSIAKIEGVEHADVTLQHEILHMVADIFLTKGEQRFLVQSFQQKGETDQQTWERIADTYGFWDGKAYIGVETTLFNRIMLGAQKLFHAIRGLFFQTSPQMSVEKLFGMIRSGEIYNREAAYNVLGAVNSQGKPIVGGIVGTQSRSGRFTKLVPRRIADPQRATKAVLPLVKDPMFRSVIALANRGTPTNPAYDYKWWQRAWDIMKVWGVREGEKREGISGGAPSRAEYYLSLPFWLAVAKDKLGNLKYPLWSKSVKLEEHRFNTNSNKKYEWTKASETYQKLKESSIAMLDPVMEWSTTIGKHYLTDAELRDENKIKEIYAEMKVERPRTKLTENEIKGYLETAAYLRDVMLPEINRHAESQLLRPYELRGALTPKEFSSLQQLFKARMQGRPVSGSVMNGIFAKVTKEHDGRKVKKAYQKLDKQLSEIRRLRESTGELDGYFPLKRAVGSHYVWIKRTFTGRDGKEKSEYVHSYTAPNFNAAMRIKEYLEGQMKTAPEFAARSGEKFELGVDRHQRLEDSSYFMVSDYNTQRIIDIAIANAQRDSRNGQGNNVEFTAEDAETISKAVYETIADVMRSRGAGQHGITRKVLEWEKSKVVQGYIKNDFRSVLNSYVTGYHGMISKFNMAMDSLEVMKEINDDQPQMFEDISKYFRDMLRNADKWDRRVAKIKNTAFTWYILGKISSVVLQMSQNFVTGIPILSAEMRSKGIKHAPLAAEGHILKALFDVTAERIGSQTPEERAFLLTMLRRGDTMAQFWKDIEVEGKSGLPKVWFKTMQLLAWPFSYMEQKNREAAALAYYRVMKGKIPADKIEEETSKYVAMTHYWMGKGNLPALAAGGDATAKAVNTAYTFQRFSHNYALSMMYGMQNYGGRVGLLMMARSLAWLTILAGIPALPFIDDLLTLIEKFFGKPIRQEARNFAYALGGKNAEKLGSSGGLGFLLGDMSAAISPLGLPFMGTPAETFIGVYAGMAKKGVDAVKAMGVGDYERMFEVLSPTFIENALKAKRLYTVGATTGQGEIVYTPEGKPLKLETMAEATLQSLGFKQFDYSIAQTDLRTERNILEYYNAQKKSLYERQRRATTDTERMRVMMDMIKFNQSIPMEASKLVSPAKWQKTNLPKKNETGYFRMVYGERLR